MIDYSELIDIDIESTFLDTFETVDFFEESQDPTFDHDLALNSNTPDHKYFDLDVDI